MNRRILLVFFILSFLFGALALFPKTTAHAGLTQGATATPRPTASATPRPVTPTITPVPGPCSPVNATITVPFTKLYQGNFCWKASTISWIYSYNMASLNVNGINFTNKYAAASSLPAKIDGFWYITYLATNNFAGFEAH